MSEEQRIILIADVLEQKLRKEKELEELQRKIGYLRREVDLTNVIIDMIKSEQVYDIKERMLERYDNQLIKKDESE